MPHSLNKGKSFEREVAAWFRSLGLPGRRTAQVDGGLAADVLTVPGLHVECKRRARIGAARFMDQAVCDAGADVPLVFMREDRGPMLVMARADDVERVVQKARDGSR